MEGEVEMGEVIERGNVADSVRERERDDLQCTGLQLPPKRRVAARTRDENRCTVRRIGR
jgi:hypothetical protein